MVRKKIESLYETIKHLERRELSRFKEGYGGDANKLAFKRHILILLKELSDKLDNLKLKKKKRKPSEWSLFAGKCMKEGMTIQEASGRWRLEKAKR